MSRMKPHVMYEGRLVPMERFRAFVYSYGDQKKLVNSWKEFEESIHSGLWFSNKSKIPEKPKPKKKAVNDGSNSQAVC